MPAQAYAIVSAIFMPSWRLAHAGQRVCINLTAGSSTMQAIRYNRYGGPEMLQLEDVPLPEPGPGQVRVDLRAASVIPADWKVRAGHLKNLFPIAFPKIPGRDGAGVVGKLGAGVDYIAAGTPVCVVAQHVEPGTYAQSIVRDRESIVPLPTNLGFEEGAALM